MSIIFLLTEVRKEKKNGAFEVIKMDEVGMTIFERGSAATQGKP
jgi:hypothetical protein